MLDETRRSIFSHGFVRVSDMEFCNLRKAILQVRERFPFVKFSSKSGVLHEVTDSSTPLLRITDALDVVILFIDITLINDVWNDGAINDLVFE